MYRLITENERRIWSSIIAESISFIPYMRDIIANIRPVYSEKENFIAAIDKHWRCSLGKDFFGLSLSEQCGVVVHEALHCVNNHFARFIMNHGYMDYKDNIAADLEINTTLKMSLVFKLPKGALYPSNYKLPDNQSYEYYYDHLNVETNNDSETSFDLLSESDCEEITKLGMPEMSNQEKVTARHNTFLRASEYQKSIGNVAGMKDKILQLILINLCPAKVDWKHQLSSCISRHRYAISNRKSDYSYRKVNRRVSNKDIAPGSLSYMPKLILGIDVSSSVSEKEHLSMLAEVDSIIRQQSQQIEVFAMDTQIGDIQLVDSVDKIKLFDGGGTSLECGFKYVKDLPKNKKPDIFIVFTDGENDWNNCKPYLDRNITYIIISTTNSEWLNTLNFGEVIVIDK